MLAQTGAAAVGVDYDLATLRGLHARRIQGDATRLPFADLTADVVVSFETIEHVNDATALVAEFRRVLKSGGDLILSTPNRAFRASSNPFHIREFTADELRAMLHRYFPNVQLFGQRPSAAYRYVPFLMVNSDYAPSALAWKTMLRFPFHIRNGIALALTGKPFYPGEEDYCFDPQTNNSHALVAIAR
jgi:SAM-dependent methyltransferase